MNIDLAPLTSLNPSPWQTVHILRPDERLLIDSLSEYGWLQNIVVRSEDRTIIDGHQRWRLAMDDKKVKARVGDTVPVQWVSCDEVDAMIMHIRLNRARGNVVAKRLSNLLRQIAAVGKYDLETLRKALVMTEDEFDVLYDGQFIKTKAIAAHNYSKAWVPIEAPKPGQVLAGEMVFERPVNPDN